MKADSNKIGEYIHAKYNDYLWYGLNHTNKEHLASPPNPYSVFRLQRNLILSQARAQGFGNTKTNKRKELEGYLNYFWNPNSGFQKIAKDLNIHSDELLQHILEAVRQAKFSTYDFNFTSNLGVENLQSAGGFNKFNNLKNNSDMLQVKSIDDRLSKALSFLNNLTDKQKSSFQNLDDLIAQANKLNNIWINIKKDFTNEQKKKRSFKFQNNKNIENDLKLKNNNIFNSLKEGNRSIGGFIDEVNILVDSLKSYSISYLIGQIGELAPTIIGRMIQQKTYKTEKELIDDIVKTVLNPNNSNLMIQQTGFNSSVALMDKSNFAVQGLKYGLQEINDQHYFRHFGKASADLRQTQDKVDFVIKMEDGESINASMKNYNLSANSNPNITILTGRNILYYLQEYNLFMNHYLNITAVLKNEFSKNKNVDKSISSYSTQAEPWEIYEANKMLIYSLALKGIAGGVLKGKVDNGKISSVGTSAMAQVFVVNDNSGVTGHYKVYFIDDYINLLKSNYNNLERFIASNIPYTKQWNQYLVNPGKPDINSAYARILKLLKLVSYYPIHLQIPKSILPIWYNMS